MSEVPLLDVASDPQSNEEATDTRRTWLLTFVDSELEQQFATFGANNMVATFTKKWTMRTVSVFGASVAMMSLAGPDAWQDYGVLIAFVGCGSILSMLFVLAMTQIESMHSSLNAGAAMVCGLIIPGLFSLAFNWPGLWKTASGGLYNPSMQDATQHAVSGLWAMVLFQSFYTNNWVFLTSSTTVRYRQTVLSIPLTIILFSISYYKAYMDVAGAMDHPSTDMVSVTL
jgi:hypothetical protein